MKQLFVTGKTCSCFSFKMTSTAISQSYTSYKMMQTYTAPLRIQNYKMSSLKFWDSEYCLTYCPEFWPCNFLSSRFSAPISPSVLNSHFPPVVFLQRRVTSVVFLQRRVTSDEVVMTVLCLWALRLTPVLVEGTVLIKAGTADGWVDRWMQSFPKHQAL